MSDDATIRGMLRTAQASGLQRDWIAAYHAAERVGQWLVLPCATPGCGGGWDEPWDAERVLCGTCACRECGCERAECGCTVCAECGETVPGGAVCACDWQDTADRDGGL